MVLQRRSVSNATRTLQGCAITSIRFFRWVAHVLTMVLSHLVLCRPEKVYAAHLLEKLLAGKKTRATPSPAIVRPTELKRWLIIAKPLMKVLVVKSFSAATPSWPTHCGFWCKAHKQANKHGPSLTDRWLNAMSGRAVEVANECKLPGCGAFAFSLAKVCFQAASFWTWPSLVSLRVSIPIITIVGPRWCYGGEAFEG